MKPSARQTSNYFILHVQINDLDGDWPLKKIKQQHFTLLRIWGGRRGTKRLPLATNFSPATSTNVGISLQNFLTFSFNSFPHWCEIPSSYVVSVPDYWTWTRNTLQKDQFFWLNLYTFEVMITFAIEMLQLQ